MHTRVTKSQQVYQNTKDRAKARSAAITLANIKSHLVCDDLLLGLPRPFRYHVRT